jgi:hypothetical protein
MNRLERYYFINEDGSEDKIIFSIDCYEKILYHALRDYNIDYKLVFCDDINLKMIENNIFHFELNKLHLNDGCIKFK